VIPILLFAVGGVLLGGAWSMRGQGASKAVVLVLVVLAGLAVAGGVLWLFPGRS
jgi:hypothetical protein